MATVLKNLPVFSCVLGISETIAACDCPAEYRIFEIKSRGSGKSRVIEAPCDHLKQAQRMLLDRILVHVEPHDAATAFVRGKSIALNARRHHGASHLFKTDIRSFFPSITATHVSRTIEMRFPHLSPQAMNEIVELVTWDARLPHGAPTSPHIANLVMYDFDERTSWFCQRLGATYTRYADDISISGQDTDTLRRLEAFVSDGLRALCMEMNPEKTRHFGPHERRSVTGLDIGGARIRPTRAFRKKAAALVRMTEKYPKKMERHRDRILGHLAFWNDVDPSDRDLFDLLRRMGLATWAQRVRPQEEPKPDSHMPF